MTANPGLLPPAITRIVEEQWRRLSPAEMDQWLVLGEVSLAVCCAEHEVNSNSMVISLRLRTTRNDSVVPGMSLSRGCKTKGLKPVAEAQLMDIIAQCQIGGLGPWVKTTDTHTHYCLL